jgi:hypothetical protein
VSPDGAYLAYFTYDPDHASLTQGFIQPPNRLWVLPLQGPAEADTPEPEATEAAEPEATEPAEETVEAEATEAPPAETEPVATETPAPEVPEPTAMATPEAETPETPAESVTPEVVETLPAETEPVATDTPAAEVAETAATEAEATATETVEEEETPAAVSPLATETVTPEALETTPAETEPVATETPVSEVVEPAATAAPESEESEAETVEEEETPAAVAEDTQLPEPILVYETETRFEFLPPNLSWRTNDELLLARSRFAPDEVFALERFGIVHATLAENAVETVPYLLPAGTILEDFAVCQAEGAIMLAISAQETEGSWLSVWPVTTEPESLVELPVHITRIHACWQLPR